MGLATYIWDSDSLSGLCRYYGTTDVMEVELTISCLQVAATDAAPPALLYRWFHKHAIGWLV